MVYLEPVFLADLPIQPGVHRNLMQINHSAAVVTAKVIVRADVCSKALLSGLKWFPKIPETAENDRK